VAEGTLIDLNEKAGRKRHYETIFIVSPAVTDAEAKKLAEKNAALITENNSTILRQDDWGKKKMAYEIEKHAMGRYYYFRYIGTHVCVNALERSLKLDANVLRYKTVRLSSDVLTEAAQAKLVEAAPQEESSAPSFRRNDDDYDSRGSDRARWS
jgi:small subunit ribosomal protein S6